MTLTQLKALDNSNRIGGYLVPFGSPEELDLDGEYFDPSTEGVDTYFKSLQGNLPVILHHNHFRQFLGSYMKTKGVPIPADLPFEVPVGRIVKLEKQDKGWWAEAILEAVDAAHVWYVEVAKRMIQKGQIYWSSGSPAMPQTARVASDGRIHTAYVIEGSLTPTPKNSRHTAVSMQRVRHALKALNIDIPKDLADEESTEREELQESNKAVSMSERERQIRVEFAVAERAASDEQARFNATVWEVYPNHLIVDLGEKKYRVDFDAELNFAPRDRWIEVQMEWIPVMTDPESPAMDAQEDAQEELKAQALAELDLLTFDLN